VVQAHVLPADAGVKTALLPQANGATLPEHFGRRPDV
jgi:hypothetical protein